MKHSDLRANVSRRSNLLGAGGVFVAGLLMLAWTWRCWPDPLVDFGTEMYLAWRLSLGDRLYADYAYLYGPLSPYLNALWFKIAGVSFMSLAMFNLALAVLLTILLYRHFLRLSGSLGAVLAGMTFVLLFAFSQYVGIANYNYLSPYAHPMTHGMLLSVALLCVLGRMVAGSNLRPPESPAERGIFLWAMIAGVMLGLIFLTKPEIFVAAACATAAAMLAWLWLSCGAGRVWPALLVMLVTIPMPTLIAWWLLAFAMESDVAWSGLTSGWSAIFAGEVSDLPFFRKGMGLDDTRGNLRDMGMYIAAGVAILAAIIAAAATLGRAVGNKPHLKWPGVIVLAGVSFAATWWLAGSHVYQLGKPLPVVMLAIIVFDSVIVLRRDARADHRHVMRLIFAVFALALLGKMILHPRIYHYGFVLAMPAMLLTVVVAIESLPRKLAAWRVDSLLLRASLLGIWLAVVLVHLDLTQQSLHRKQTLVAQSEDAFHADDRGLAVNEVSDVLRKIISPGQTLVVLPEGVMFNYLLRMKNPTRFILLMPTETVTFGEAAVEQSFAENPPDFILLVHKDTSEFGYRFFGRDYAQGLFMWIQHEYVPVTAWYAVPLQDDRFGVMLVRHRRNTIEPVLPVSR